MGSSIRKNQSVDAEIAITGSSFRTKITSICPKGFSFIVLSKQALIHPIPDESSLQNWILFDHIPIILQVTYRISHGMCIFALDQGTIVGRIQGIAFHIFNRCIHWTPNICMSFDRIGHFLGTFILHWPAFIPFFDPVVISQHIMAISGFIP